MKKILMAFVVAAGLIFSGCGSDDSDPEDVLDSITTKNSVAFADLQDHTIKVRERHVHDAVENVIVFCKDGKVASGSHKDGTYAVAAQTVTMTFASAVETLKEGDADATFKHDEHVLFDGRDYIITSIHSVPAGSAVCN